MIIGFNKKAEEMFGYSREEILGKPPYLLGVQRSRENQKKVLEKFKEVGSLFHIDKKIMEAIGLKKDGKEFPAELSHYIFEHYGEVIFSATVRDITERKSAEAKLIEYQNQLRSLASQLTLAEEHERRRFATYLHDHIGQTLFGIHMKLDLLKHSLSTNDDIKPLEEVKNSIQQMITDTRLLTFELSPPILYESNLESALDSLIERMHEQYGIMVTLKNDRQEKLLDDDIKVFLFQAVRELLINVVKHAQAKSVSISIQKENTRIRIHVEDDGVGFIPPSNYFSQDKSKGFGLFSIRERLSYVGGSLEIKSQPGHVTKITILSPLRAKKRKSKEK
jgi:PAS domain S-box-containing protein